jgi:hypothetical protein
MIPIVLIDIIWYSWGFWAALLAFFVGAICKQYGLEAGREEANIKLTGDE